MDEYTRQAEKFLKRWGIKFMAKHRDSKCPPSCNGENCQHGDRHQVTFKRWDRKLTLWYWNSHYDKVHGIKEVTAYDVLASLTKEEPPKHFETFCCQYGYDTDSRRAYKVWQAVVNEYKRVKMFFREPEIWEGLVDIQ